MVVVRVDLRHISDEKKLSYSDVLWQYVKQDFLWRINNAGLGNVLWLQKPYFVTGEKLAFYYVYGSPGGRAEDNGTPFDVLRNIIIGNAGLNSHSDVVWTNTELSKQTAKVSANEPAFVWPLLFGALVAIGKAIVGFDVVGAGIYAFLNRLLIPTGLHHALNNVFWFDTIGLGDLSHFWNGETSKDVSWSLGMYMSGFFPCMMFGIPGAALAMVKCAKPAKKKAAIGILASAAICAFICGVTEPFEFAFMFLAPVLYVIYALLYGIFTMITVALGFRAGFSFSAGAMDLLFSSSLPAAAKTWLIIPLGIAAFIVFYIVFYFAIKKWDLKTPGREDDDVEAEKKAVLSNNDYTAVAKTILEGCGGKDNIASIDNCITRLRLEVKDITQVDDKKIKSAGVAGVMKPGKNSVQVIIGTKVQFVADEFSKLCE